jgi:tRNA 2-thiouridine synthesizing protein A
MIEFNQEVDASGLMCPLPLLRLKKMLMGMDSGDVVKVIVFILIKRAIKSLNL